MLKVTQLIKAELGCRTRFVWPQSLHAASSLIMQSEYLSLVSSYDISSHGLESFTLSPRAPHLASSDSAEGKSISVSMKAVKALASPATGAPLPC